MSQPRKPPPPDKTAVPAPAPSPAPSPTEQLAKWLAGAAVALTGILGFLGIAGAERDQLLRNEPSRFLLFMTLVGVAIGLGLIAPIFSRGLAALMVFVGVLILGWGLWGMSKIAIHNKAAKERPRVVANLVADAQGTWLDANVSARGLRSDEHVLVRVEGRSTRRRLALWHTGTPEGWEDVTAWQERENVEAGEGIQELKGVAIDYFQLLYATRIGPDQEGKISLPIKVKVSPGLYERAVVSAELVGEDETKGTAEAVTTAKKTADKTRSEESKAALKELTQRRCTTATRTWGCATISFAPRDRRPTLSATWKGSGDALSLAVTGKMLGFATDDQLALFVAGLRKLKGHGTTLYRAFPVADPTGSLGATIDVAVPKVFQAVCVTAIAVPSGYGDIRSVTLAKPAASSTRSGKAPTSTDLDILLKLPRMPRSGCTLEGSRVGTIFLRVPGSMSRASSQPTTNPK